ncbi:MAG: type II toxin-antitoxin system VapC family toxin [Candidatus Altiarchaeota archaeon]|nr:type II toxin-antitoxin system VapC family toxin [Candidatus Altiarchaeota archaeon]
MMVCFDTDILVGLLRGDPNAKEKIKNFQDKGIEVSTTPINACELFKGAFKSAYPKENSDLVGSLLKNMKLLNFDIKSSKIIGEEMDRLRRRGDSLGEMDVMIAGMAIANNEILVTKNINHFKRIRNLRIEVW